MHGRVVSNKMDKTVVIEVQRHVTHPRYKKKLRRVNKFKAHDEHNSCELGDIVKIVETRPLSKTKRWRVLIEKEKTLDKENAVVTAPSEGENDPD